MARSSAPRAAANGSNEAPAKGALRCAIYTRKSTEEGLQQDFNSLDAQREAAEAFILSQKREGWQVVADHFDDGGYTLAEFDAIWSSLTTKEQEQMIHLLVAKVGYDGRTGKVTVNFSNQGAKELCQGRC